jgi:hypothetical protein
VKRRWCTVAAYYGWLGLVLCMLVRGVESIDIVLAPAALLAWGAFVRATPRWLDPRGSRSLLDVFGGFVAALVVLTVVRESVDGLRFATHDVALSALPVAAICGLAWARCYAVDCELGVRDAQGVRAGQDRRRVAPAIGVYKEPKIL